MCDGVVFEFGIDKAELDQLSPQQIFVLGWEASSIWAKLSDENMLEFSLMIITNNVSRIKRMCIKLGWIFKFTRTGETESWVTFEVERDPLFSG